MKDTKNIKKFFKTVFARKVTIINAIIVLLFIFLALFAPFVAPYDPDKPTLRHFFRCRVPLIFSEPITLDEMS